MRIVVQRAKEAYVKVGGNVVGKIAQGMVVLVGVAKTDSTADADSLVKKIIELRIFEDKEGKMNLSSLEAGAEFLVVSQFTLLGDCSKGRRPSFDSAADPQKAEQFYNYFIEQLRKHHVRVETGQFRAMMDVGLVNDGPVTFILESKLERSTGAQAHRNISM